MIETLRQTPPTTVVADTFSLLRDTAAYLTGNVMQIVQRSRDARMIQELDDTQLRDMGIARSDAQPNVASFAIEAGVMGKLMSMR
jgi:uncharacterized protein YjiS (DUF1127 family)